MCRAMSSEGWWAVRYVDGPHDGLTGQMRCATPPEQRCLHLHGQDYTRGGKERQFAVYAAEVSRRRRAVTYRFVAVEVRKIRNRGNWGGKGLKGAPREKLGRSD